MIQVKYNGRLGNNMFQYALGRYLAENMGYTLSADPLPFARTNEIVSGQSYEEPLEILEKQTCDVPAILANPSKRKVVLDGYFQHSQYYLHFMSKIRGWFTNPLETPKELANVNDSDLLIMVRLGDYFNPLQPNSLFASLTHQFYEMSIEMASPRRIYIVTDEPDHPYLTEFKRFSPVILIWKHGDKPILDLFSAQHFKKVAMSCSTFAWWAVMLSDATEIYFPIDEDGIWSVQRNDLASQKKQVQTAIDLRIDDPRFTYFYNCPTVKTNRVSPGVAALSARQSVLSSFHLRSNAFWYD
jgi:hypothetical protein